MKLFEAEIIAKGLVKRLKPYCERIEIAGSIRRRKLEPNDIEIVCIPIEVEGKRHPEFVKVVESLDKIKGEPTGKYTQRMTPEGIKLDLFIARKENWGFVFAQRTGSADYSHYILAKGWVKKGYKSVDTILVKDGVQYPMLEEEDVFNIVGIPYIKPEERSYKHVPASKVKKEE